MNPLRPFRRNEEPVKFRISGGHNTLATQVGDNVSIRAIGRGRRFGGSWQCYFSGDGLVVGRGFLNALEPMIGEKFISGIDAKSIPYPDGPPVLQLSNGLYDATGRSWICIRVQVDINGKMKEKEYTDKDLSIIQSDAPRSRDPFVGLKNIAMLFRSPGDAGWGELIQQSWFDYQHTVSPATKDRQMRHQFPPA